MNHFIPGTWKPGTHFCLYCIWCHFWNTHTYWRRFVGLGRCHRCHPTLMCCVFVLECEWLISNAGICSHGSNESLRHLYFWSCCSTPHQRPGWRVNKQSSHVSGPADRNTERVCWHSRLWTHSYRQTRRGTMQQSHLGWCSANIQHIECVIIHRKSTFSTYFKKIQMLILKS